MGVKTLHVYQSWKFVAGWPFHFEQTHSFPLRGSPFPSEAWHHRKSSMIVLLNQWLHYAGSVPFGEQHRGSRHAPNGASLWAVKPQCPRNSDMPIQLPWMREYHERCVLNSACYQNKETAPWFLVWRKRMNKHSLCFAVIFPSVCDE